MNGENQESEDTKFKNYSVFQVETALKSIISPCLNKKSTLLKHFKFIDRRNDNHHNEAWHYDTLLRNKSLYLSGCDRRSLALLLTSR